MQIIRKSSAKASLVALALSLFAFVALADDWSHYLNARYAYSLDIPPGFSGVAESDNGDGGLSMSGNGRAELRVWGGSIVDDDGFAGEIAWRIKQDRSGGWTIAYERHTGRAASWSGSKGGRIFYQRSIPGCGDAAIHFRLEYDRADLKVYDPVIRRLVKSLRKAC